MAQSQSNLPINHLSPSASLLQPSRNSMHKSTAIATSSFEDIQNPVQIATRGTVGSLVMQELKYFSQVESSHGSSQKSHPHVTVMASTSNQSKTIPGSALSTSKKKLRGGSRRLPRICSVVEVSDCSRPIGNSGFSYRNLKSEAKKLQA